MESVAHQEKSLGVEDRKLPSGRELCVEVTRGHGLWRIGFADRKPGFLPDKYAGKYTKPEYAEEDLKKYLREHWEVYRAQSNQEEVEKIKAQIESIKAQLDTPVPDETVSPTPKKRGRKPKVKVEEVA